MGGRTAYPWVLYSKITVEDRFYINLFSVFQSQDCSNIVIKKILLHIIRRIHLMNFEMTGKLSIPKETEKFKPFNLTKFPKTGWVNKRLMFNVACGDNRHMLTVSSGAFEDESKSYVYTFSKSGVDDNGNKIKGESLKIPFKERLTSPKLAEVAEFKKFIFDLEKPGRRYKLEKAAEKIREGKNLTDEELKELYIEDEAALDEALEKSNKKRHEFISEWDFIDFIKKVIDSGKYSDKKFFIRGNGEYQYSDKNERVYESYVPNRIYLAADDAEESSTATINILFNSESLDDMSVEEKGFYSLDEITILSNMNQEVIEKFEDKGGWETIQHQIDIINTQNFDTYIDILYRENIMMNMYRDLVKFLTIGCLKASYNTKKQYKTIIVRNG
mgnify:CR=1 FL=1